MLKKLLLGITLLNTLISFAQVSDSTMVRDIRRLYGYNKFRFGGYGEILYQHMDYGPNRMIGNGAEPDSRGIVDLPRMVLSLDYKFKNGFAFSTEIEFEHGGTGSTVEYEYEESGEWETEVEKGGEVVLEQFFLSKYFSDAFILKAGHFLVPVGLTNQNHIPTQFFGSVRPEGENTILPLTWHETGLALAGRVKRWFYEAQIISGLDANGMTSQYWVKNARQSQYEYVKMNSPAFALRVDNRSIKYLKLGVSAYTGKSAPNTSKPEKYEDIDGRVNIVSADAVYNNRNLIFRGNVVYGTLGDSKAIYEKNTNVLSRYSPYSPSPVAENIITYSAEAGYNILRFFNAKTKLYPFARYEYYNSMEKMENDGYADPRYRRTVTTVGINYFPLNNLVIKVDYAMRKIDGGNYNDENTLGISIGYSGFFINK